MKLTLVKVSSEAKDTKTFYWKPESKIEYLPGQYYYFTLPKLRYPSERGNTRHFTLSSSPTEDLLSFTTKIREESGYKKTLVELPIGSEIEGSGPNGTFTLDETSDTSNVFIAGGIGITPFRSIIKYVFDNKLSTNIHLIYSASIPSQLLFKNEFDDIAHKSPTIVNTYTITQPEGLRTKWTEKIGRIDDTLLQDVTTDTERNISIFWVCGPPLMVTALEESLSNLGIPKEHIRSEKFTGY
jgi:ferredoxin-NADP reductase